MRFGFAANRKEVNSVPSSARIMTRQAFALVVLEHSAPVVLGSLKMLGI
jgi:hypothetical protein